MHLCILLIFRGLSGRLSSWGGQCGWVGVSSHAYFCNIILNSYQRGMQREETAIPKEPSKCLTAVPCAKYVFHQISKQSYVMGKYTAASSFSSLSKLLFIFSEPDCKSTHSKNTAIMMMCRQRQGSGSVTGGWGDERDGKTTATLFLRAPIKRKRWKLLMVPKPGMICWDLTIVLAGR